MTPAGVGYLDRIVADRRRDLSDARARVPEAALERRVDGATAPLDFAGVFRGPGVGLMGEIKRTSPAKGVLSRTADPAAIATAYAANGVKAISVLTESRHFNGSLDDLLVVKAALAESGVSVPLLRKDFLVDPYQVLEARAYGADAVLIIVSIVDDSMMRMLLSAADALGLGALVEVNSEVEVDRALAAGATVIGINNRDLQTFEVDLETSGRLKKRIPSDVVVLALSGISRRQDVERLREWRIDGMLVGEALMTANDPGAKAAEMVAWGQGQAYHPVRAGSGS